MTHNCRIHISCLIGLVLKVKIRHIWLWISRKRWHIIWSNITISIIYVFRLVCLHLTLTICKCKGQGHAYLSVDISQTEKHGTDCYCQQIWSRRWLFDLHIYIWPWLNLNVKVKVMHIFAVSISQTVTYKVSVAVANKYAVAHMAFREEYINWFSPFLKVSVMIMDMWTVNIAQTV